MKKRISSFLIAITMVLTLIPSVAFAGENDTVINTNVQPDLSNGSIIVRNCGEYTQIEQNSDVIKTTGNVIIKQSNSAELSTDNNVKIYSDDIDFKVSIIDLNVVTYSPIQILGKATLNLLGDSYLKTVSNGYGGKAAIGVECIQNDDDTYSLCELKITGSGKVTAIGGAYSAGIGGDFYSDAIGNITIESGTIVADGGSYAAGIGGGSEDAAINKIIINGGNITATGYNGIGTGYEGNTAGYDEITKGQNSLIEINGGTVVAKADGHGTGIGGHSSSYDNHIHITGGDVTAEAEYGGYAIGGSGDSRKGDITISGGTVTAINEWGTAIGGYYGLGNVHISNATVNITAKYYAIGSDIDTRVGCDSIVIEDNCTMNVTSELTNYYLEKIVVEKVKNQAAISGNKVKFYVEASGNSGLSYQWQTNNSTDKNGKNWVDVEGQTSATMEIPVTEENNGYYYRCRLINGYNNGLYSSVATANILGFETQPVSIDASLGDFTSFSATANCDNVTYQWQETKDNGDTWSDISGENTKSLLINEVTLAHVYRSYRCVITADNGDKLISNVVKLNVDISNATAPDIIQDNIKLTCGKEEKIVIAANGNQPIEWMLVDGKLPKGMTLENNILSGIPVEAGTFTIKVKAQNVIGSDTETIKIEVVALDITKASVSLSQTKYTYSGEKNTPRVTVTFEGKTLENGTDYSVSYKNNVNAGTATVTVTGIGNYEGSINKTFTISKVSLTGATVTLSQTSFNYNGKAKIPGVTVKVGNKKLTGNDYTVTYKNNKNIGKATVTITGKGNYKGTCSKTFTISAKKGTTFTYGAYKYKITGSSTVAFAGIKSIKTTNVIITNTVKYGGKTFKVTSIADKALYKKTKVTKVTIGSNVTAIGKSVFEGCTKLSSVTIGSKVTKIGDKTFYGCKKLKTITIKTTKLKSVGKNAFKNIYAKATIKVPKSKLKAYQKLMKGKGQGSKVKITK